MPSHPCLYAGCKRLLEKLPGGNSDATIGAACLLYKEGNYDEARKLFTSALNISGYQPELAYNIALCYYQVKQYGPALKHIAQIIERGVREHPELSVGAAAIGGEVRSVCNSQAGNAEFLSASESPVHLVLFSCGISLGAIRCLFI